MTTQRIDNWHVGRGDIRLSVLNQQKERTTNIKKFNAGGRQPYVEQSSHLKAEEV
jgi:hypothetical protein